MALSVLLLAAVSAMLGTASAHAESQRIELLSRSGADLDAFVAGASSDASRVFFETAEAIAGTGDGDNLTDIYLAAGGQVTLVSPGVETGDAWHVGNSVDGSRMFFETTERIPGTGDTDVNWDVYRYQAGVVTLISGNGVDTDSQFEGATPDGSQVFFETDQQIAGTGDADTATDVYRNQNGTITLLSGGTANTPAFFEDASADGSRVFFESSEPITAADGDSGTDVYRNQTGALALLTSSGAAIAARYEDSSADGSRVFFSTDERMSSSDPDGSRDIYRHENGITSLISGGGASLPATFRGASTDGSRVFFSTSEALAGTGDADSATDVYRAEGGAITLLSGSGSADSAFFEGASADGSRVFFLTDEPIAGTGDTDGSDDLYRSAGGGIALVSPGTADITVFFEGASTDGSRVFFSTYERLPGTGDQENAQDVYRVDGSQLRLFTGGTDRTRAFADRVSDDGSRLIFNTFEPLPGTGDDDGGIDVFSSTVVPDTVSTTPNDDDDGCMRLRTKLKRAKTKKARKRIRRQLRRRGC